jgi:hypothetical protein
MASARATATSRRSSPGRSSKKDTEAQVSPARWAGVAFVITAIVAAIILGMLSPSDPSPAVAGSSTATEASPTPAASSIDERVPTARPTITNPRPDVTREIIIPVTVKLPAEELPADVLDLLIMRGDDILKTHPEPKTGDTVTVEGVEIADGVNELTALLKGPGGWGPRSEPVSITVDREAPDLLIVSPEDRHVTYEDTVRVEIAWEPGADVTVRNATRDFRQPLPLGPSGDVAVTVPLKLGVWNTIKVRGRDRAGVPRTAQVEVKRVDGTPRIKIKKIDPLRRSALPAKIKVIVTVRDAEGEPMEGAEVSYALGGADRTTDVSVGYTNAKGRSSWNPTVSGSSSTADALELVVTVTSSLSEDTATETQKIPFE